MLTIFCIFTLYERCSKVHGEAHTAGDRLIQTALSKNFNSSLCTCSWDPRSFVRRRTLKGLFRLNSMHRTIPALLQWDQTLKMHVFGEEPTLWKYHRPKNQHTTNHAPHTCYPDVDWYFDCGMLIARSYVLGSDHKILLLQLFVQSLACSMLSRMTVELVGVSLHNHRAFPKKCDNIPEKAAKIPRCCSRVCYAKGLAELVFAVG